MEEIFIMLSLSQSKRTEVKCLALTSTDKTLVHNECGLIRLNRRDNIDVVPRLKGIKLVLFSG